MYIAFLVLNKYAQRQAKLKMKLISKHPLKKKMKLEINMTYLDNLGAVILT